MTNKLYLKQALCPRLVLVDGLTRSGKMLTAKLVSNLRRMEYFQAYETVDHIPILWRLGKIDDDTACAFLRMEMDATIYNRAIGRNLNLRRADSSSLHHALNYEEYANRADDPMTDGVMERFNREGRWPVFFTHEMLPNARLFFSIVDDLRIVVPVRHPVDLAYSWFRRGWGERWGTDPLAFIPTVDAGADPVPWFAAKWAEEYLALRPADRVIRSILALLSLFEQTYWGLSPERQRRVHFLAYERLLSEPEREVNRLAKFLETEPLDGIAAVFEREGLPAAGTGAPGDKLKKIEGLATPENVARLVEVGRRHEKAWGLAPTAA